MKRKGCLAVLLLNIATNIVDNLLTAERVFVLVVDGLVVDEGIILRFGGNLKGGEELVVIAASGCIVIVLVIAGSR